MIHFLKLNQKQDWLIWNTVLLLPFFKPAAFDSFVPLSFLDVVFDAGKVLATFYVIVYLIRTKRINLFVVSTFIFTLCVLLATLIGGGSIQQWATQWFSCFVVGAWVQFAFKQSRKSLCEAVVLICCAWLICNLISIIIFYPEGMYRGANWIQKDNYFWGQKNSLIRLIIPGITCSVLLDLAKENKYSARTYLIALVGFIQITLVTSVTSITVCTLFYIILTLLQFKKINGFLIYCISCVCVLIVDILVVIMRIQEWGPISYLINEVFNKDATLTGRSLIWDNSLNRINNSPLFGIGVRTESKPISEAVNAVHAHNDLLNVTLMGGLISLASYLFCLILAAVRLKRVSRTEGAVIAGAIGAFLVVGISEPIISPSMFLLLAVAYILPEV